MRARSRFLATAGSAYAGEQIRHLPSAEWTAMEAGSMGVQVHPL